MLRQVRWGLSTAAGSAASGRFHITSLGYRRGAQRRVPPAHLFGLGLHFTRRASRRRRRSGHRSVIWSAPLASCHSRALWNGRNSPPATCTCPAAEPHRRGRRTAPHQLLPPLTHPGPSTSIAPRAQSRWNRGGAAEHIIAVQRSSAFQITFRGYRRGAQRRVPPAHVVLLNAATAPPAGKPPRRRSGHRSVIWSAPLLSGRSRATLERSKVDGDAPNLSRCRTAAGASTATHQLLSVRPVPAGDVDRTANAKPLEPGRGGGAHHCCSALQRIPDNVSRLPTRRAAPCPAGPCCVAKRRHRSPGGQAAQAAQRSPLCYLECASPVRPKPCNPGTVESQRRRP